MVAIEKLVHLHLLEALANAYMNWTLSIISTKRVLAPHERKNRKVDLIIEELVISINY